MSSINAEQLNQLFDQNSWPRFDHVEMLDEVVRLRAYVPTTLDYFDGHFPEQAVLPGVVQVHWVGELAQKIFAVSGFSELKSIKFSSMILPEQEILLELKYAAAKGTVRFSYTSGEDKFSSGMLSFSVIQNDANKSEEASHD